MHDTDATTTTSRRDSRFMRGRVPQPLDVVVDRRVLLDVGVGLRDVRLGLVVVVVRDEVLDRVVRQHLPQLVGQLRRERLVRRHHQRGPLQPLDQPRRGGRLAGARGAEQHDVLLARRAGAARARRSPPAGRRPAVCGLTTSNRPPVRGMSPTGRCSECASGMPCVRACASSCTSAALPGISVANATGPRVRAPTDSFRRPAATALPGSTTVHPPKIVTFDVPARANIDTKGIERAVDEYRVAPFGLYMSRADRRPAERALDAVVAAARAGPGRHRLVSGTPATSVTRTSTSTSARSSGTAAAGGGG